MDQQLFRKARAKINLSLKVVGRRPDGYHDLNTVMARLNLADLVGLKVTASLTSDRLNVDNKLPVALPDDFGGPGNLALKAVAAFRKKCNWPKNSVAVSLEKNIPFGAGLGGRSADCAAVLRLLNILAPQPLSRDELAELGLSLGADVPFCLSEMWIARAEGVGEKLSRPPAWADLWPGRRLVLVKPGFELSTAEVFKRLGLTKRPSDNNLGPVSDPRPGDNDLLEPALELAPALAEAREQLAGLKPEAWGLSGSGPTFWLYGSDIPAESLFRARPDWWVREVTIED